VGVTGEVEMINGDVVAVGVIVCVPVGVRVDVGVACMFPIGRNVINAVTIKTITIIVVRSSFLVRSFVILGTLGFWVS